MANLPEDPKITEERTKKLLEEVKKIRKGVRDREGLRTPYARGKRKQDLVDSNKNNKKVSDRLKTFGSSLGNDIRSGVVGTVGGIVSAIPGAKSLGKAVGAATEGTSVSSIFNKFVLGKKTKTSGSESSSVESFKNVPDVGDLLNDSGGGNGDMLKVLEEIRDKICFIKDQIPTKLDRKENKNEAKLLAKSKGTGLAVAGGRGPGGQGPGGGGDDDSFLQDVAEFAVAELGIRALLSKGLRGRALSLLTLGRFGRGAATAATAASAAGRSASAASVINTTRMLPAARGAGLAARSTQAAKGANMIDMKLVKGSKNVFEAAKAGRMGQMASKIKNIQNLLTATRAGLAATTPLRAGAAIASFGLTEAISASLMFGIESNIADAISSEIQLSQGKVVKQKAVDPTTGKSYDKMVDATTGMVISDRVADSKNMDGTSAKTRVDEKYNRRRRRAINQLEVNEGHIIDSLQIAVQAHTEGEDSVANGALERAKNLMIERATIAGETGITDTSVLKKLIKFSPQGAGMMKDLLDQADDMVWESEIWDQDWVDDTVDQLNAIMDGENAALNDPGDTTKMSKLVAEAQKKSSRIARMEMLDNQADQRAGEFLRKGGEDTSFMLSEDERNRQNGLAPSNVPAMQNRPVAPATKNSLMQNTTINSSSNTTNNTMSEGDSQNSEPAFNRRGLQTSRTTFY